MKIRKKTYKFFDVSLITECDNRSINNVVVDEDGLQHVLLAITRSNYMYCCYFLDISILDKCCQVNNFKPLNIVI